MQKRGRVRALRHVDFRQSDQVPSSSSLLLSSLKLSDTQVCAPYTRALPGAASRFCEVVVLELRTVTIGTALSLGILRVIRRGIYAMWGRVRALRHVDFRQSDQVWKRSNRDQHF